MMYPRTDKSPAIMPPSRYVGNLSWQGGDGSARLWTERLSRTLCDCSCPQFTDRKKPCRCTLQAADVAQGEECSMLKRFLSGIKSPIED
jgi:hypothetical protein